MATISLSITQNFLKPTVIESVFSQFIHLPPSLPLVDIGAGTGNITSWLAKHAQNRILAYELDTTLAADLALKFGQTSNVTVIPKNFLQQQELTSPYIVVANIPFFSTTAIVQQLTRDSYFTEGYLVVQQEAAYRFGGKHVEQPATLQSTMISIDFELSILHHFKRADFNPPPHVETVLLKLKRVKSKIEQSRRKSFEDLVAYLFNKSVPEVRRAPVLGRYLARRIDLGRIQLLRKKPSELSFDDFTYLFSLCEPVIFEKLSGTADRIGAEGHNIQKIYRTRQAKNWKNMV